MSESTLLLRLAGVTQGWNGRRAKVATPGQARGTLSPDELGPTHSGVVGMIGAALGRPRGPAAQELTDLDVMVRADQPGVARAEFRTTRRRTSTGQILVSPQHEHVLDDAIFLVGVSGDRQLLDDIGWALEHPRWALGLGKREFPPLLPLMLGVRVDTTAEAALREHDWLASEWYRPTQPRTCRLDLWRPLPLPHRYWHEYLPEPDEVRGRPRRLAPVLVDNPGGTTSIDWLGALVGKPAPTPTPAPPS